MIRLANNLQVLLVSDRLAVGGVGVEAASVHVQAGHFDDTVAGLAHFHEHLLFLGEFGVVLCEYSNCRVVLCYCICLGRDVIIMFGIYFFVSCLSNVKANFLLTSLSLSPLFRTH